MEICNDKDLSNFDEDSGTCCQTKIDSSKCALVWLIHNFSYCRQRQGDSLASCIFTNKETPGDLKFRLLLYPRGTKDSPDDVVVSLRLVTDNNDIQAFVKYGVILFCGDDQRDDQRDNPRDDPKPCVTKCGQVILYPENYSVDVPLINRDELLQKKDTLMKDGTLMIGCGLASAYKEEQTQKLKSML